jgi:hypothetical protein
MRTEVLHTSADVQNETNSYTSFVPQTTFGKKLYVLRNKAIDEGMKLHSCDEILKEISSERSSR